jgi:hypothetical protein
MSDMIRTVMVEQKKMYEEQIAQLRKERDEARRMLCLEWTEHSPCFEWMEDRPVRLSKEQIAMRYGWDCFRENS